MPRKMRQSGVDWIGEIPEGWGMGVVKRCYNLILGKMLCSSPEEPNATLEKYLCAANVHFSGIDDSDLKKMWFSPAERNAYAVKSGDLLVVEGGAGAGGAAIVDKVDGFVGVQNSIIVVRSKGSSSLRVLKYWLQAIVPMGYIDYVCNKATIPHYTKEKLGNSLIPIIPSRLQNKIADYLDSKCAEIDGAVEALKTTIDDYRVMKKTLVFDAVTGKNLKGKKVPSGQDWLGDIPAAWDVRRIVNLYREVSERGDDSLPILSVSINTGVSDKELSDEEQERVFIRSEDKTKYKRVQPGDLTYNMMRAWQGAFGAVRVNGMVSPAYVVARPKVEMDSRYVEYLLRSPNATREMQRYSRGIADFRLRLYWPEFKNIRIPCPPREEQKRIADMLDEKCGEIDAIIADKERLISDLEAYKKSLIFEVVTGKREVA